MSQFVNINCPVCHANRSRRLFKIYYGSEKVLELLNLTESPGIFLFKCDNCSHHFANPIVNPNLLNKYYSEINSEYYNISDAVNYDSDELKDEHDFIVRKIEEIIDHGNVIEIGCGFGFLLEKFDPGRWNRYGVEPSPYAYNILKRKKMFSTFNGYFTDYTFGSTKFDVVLLFDVIEHLHDPNSLIELIKNRITPNGIIVIGTGNIGSINAIIGGSRWNYFSSFEHISFFSVKSITKLFNSHNLSVFKVIKKSYVGNFKLNFNTLIKNILRITLYSILKSKKNYKAHLAFDHMIVFLKNLGND
jgi:2-polyprenyl-3-methyl-5-hydroxy-6-metoxy-1,4-benzoquinol methylase